MLHHQNLGEIQQVPILLVEFAKPEKWVALVLPQPFPAQSAPPSPNLFMCTSVIADSPSDLEFAFSDLKTLIYSPVHSHPRRSEIGYWLCKGSQHGECPLTSQELEPDAKGWEFIDHDLLVVRQRYKEQSFCTKLASSVHMLFLASLILLQRNLQSISFQETLLQEEAIWGSQREETPPRYSMAIWRVPSLLDSDRTAELLLRKTLHQEADIHHVSILRNNSYSVAKEMMPLAFSWREDVIKDLSKLTAVPFLKVCVLMAGTPAAHLELSPFMTYEEGWRAQGAFEPNFLSYYCPWGTSLKHKAAF